MGLISISYFNTVPNLEIDVESGVSPRHSILSPEYRVPNPVGIASSSYLQALVLVLLDSGLIGAFL